MATKHLRTALSLVALSVVGCQFHARAPEKYRADTRAVLETRSAQIQTCYDETLKQDPNASGTVVVHFLVEEETGNIKNTQVMPTSTAPDALGQCVVQAINGLALSPPDKRTGDATFTWQFQKG